MILEERTEWIQKMEQLKVSNCCSICQYTMVPTLISEFRYAWGCGCPAVLFLCDESSPRFCNMVSDSTRINLELTKAIRALAKTLETK